MFITYLIINLVEQTKKSALIYLSFMFKEFRGSLWKYYSLTSVKCSKTLQK